MWYQVCKDLQNDHQLRHLNLSSEWGWRCPLLLEEAYAQRRGSGAGKARGAHPGVLCMLCRQQVHAGRKRTPCRSSSACNGSSRAFECLSWLRCTLQDNGQNGAPKQLTCSRISPPPIKCACAGEHQYGPAWAQQIRPRHQRLDRLPGGWCHPAAGTSAQAD